MRATALLIVAVVGTGCSGGGDSRPTIPPGDVVTLDFVGQLAAADTSRWEQVFDGSPDDIYRSASGGPTGTLLVGPATLTLDDGSAVDVAIRTPGGNLCPQLDLWQQPPDPPPGLQPGEICLVVGQYRPGTSTAAWFATLRLSGRDGLYSIPVADYDVGRALLPVGDAAFVAAPINASTSFDCFGLGFDDMLADHLSAYALVDADLDLASLECVGVE